MTAAAVASNSRMRSAIASSIWPQTVIARFGAGTVVAVNNIALPNKKIVSSVQSFKNVGELGASHARCLPPCQTNC
jgi:hypothetical protein